MKKLLVLLVSICLLAGCSVQEAPNIEVQLQQVIEEVGTNSASFIPNMSKKYYSYYLPSDVGRVQVKSLGDVFRKDGYEFTMTLNSSYLVQNYYNDDIIFQTPFTYQITGEYQSYNGFSYPYKIAYQELDNEQYFLVVDATNVEFMSIVPYVVIDNHVRSMMKIASSIQYDLVLLLNDFSARQLIQDTDKIDLEQFSNKVPDSGILSEHIQENK